MTYPIYSPNPDTQATIEQLLSIGCPPIPVAPKQNPRLPECHHQDRIIQNVRANDDPSIKGQYCRITFTKVDGVKAPVKGDYCRLDDKIQPIARFTGKNPSFIDETGKPHILRHQRYQNQLPTEYELRKWFANPANGIGTLGGHNGYDWLDFDAKNYTSQEECDRDVARIRSLTGSTWVEKTGSGGYRVAVKPKQKPTFTNFSTDPNGETHIGEALFEGRFTVLAPTIHPNGNAYRRIEFSEVAQIESLESIGIYPTKDEQANQARRGLRDGQEIQYSDPESKPWDIRNFAEYLEGYRIEKDWIKCKCPVHDGNSDNSLHINIKSGGFHCWNGCNNSLVYRTVKAIAVAAGYECSYPEMNREQERKWNRDQLRERAFKLFFERTTLKADIAKRCKHVNLAGFPLPQLGEALLVSAFTGAGKSTFFKETKDQLVNNCEYPVTADLIGHRNALMRITGKQMGMQHISDLISENHKMSLMRIRCADFLAYCVDSFLKRFDALMTHIDMGGKVLITGDELNALITHMVMGGTIKRDTRPKIIAAFSTLLQAIANGGGWFIGGESCLTPITINALRAFSNGKLKITTCQLTNGNPNPWKVYDYFYPTDAKAKHAAFHKVRQLLGQRKKVIFAIGSQEGGEQFAKLLSKWNVKLVDRWSNSDEDMREFVKSINESLPDSGIDCLIHTPSLGIGVSIDVDYFDAVVVYSAKLSPFDAIQLAGRVRKAVDRYMFVPDFSGGGKEFDPSKIVVEWEEGLEKAFKRHNRDHIQRRGVIDAATKIRSELEALNNIGSQATHDITLEILRRDGHHIIECDPLSKDELDELKLDFKLVKEAIEDDRLAEWQKAPLMRDLETAKKTLKRDNLNRGYIPLPSRRSPLTLTVEWR